MFVIVITHFNSFENSDVHFQNDNEGRILRKSNMNFIGRCQWSPFKLQSSPPLLTNQSTDTDLSHLCDRAVAVITEKIHRMIHSFFR